MCSLPKGISELLTASLLFTPCLRQHGLRFVEQGIPALESLGDEDRMSNHVLLLEGANLDRALLETGRQGGGRELVAVEVGFGEVVDQLGTTLLALVNLLLTVLGDVLDAGGGQPVEDVGLVGALQDLAATADPVAEIGVSGGEMVVDGNQTVAGNRLGALADRTEEDQAWVDDVRLAVVTREVVDTAVADAAVDLLATLDPAILGSVRIAVYSHRQAVCCEVIVDCLTTNLQGVGSSSARSSSLSSHGDDLGAALLVQLEVVMAKVLSCSSISLDGCVSKSWVVVAV